MSIGLGLFLGLIFSFYGYAFWIGGIMIKNERINPATDEVYTAIDLLKVMFGIMLGMITIVSLGPNFGAMAKALIIGQKIFEVIDRVPEIKDNLEKELFNNLNLEHCIEYKNVSFKYPTSRNM